MINKIISSFLILCLLSSNVGASIDFKGVLLNGLTAHSNSNLPYRKSIIISGSSDGVLTDYPVTITVNYGSGTDSGNNIYVAGNSNSDFSDIRFTASDGTTLLNYWREYYAPSNKAIFWIKIPSIPASPSTVSIFMYYNNSQRSYTGDGHNVFTSFIDKDNASSFNATKKWITVEQPHRLDPAIDVDIAQATNSQWYGNPASTKLLNGKYVVGYFKYAGTAYSNSAKNVLLNISSDSGKTYGSPITYYTHPTNQIAEPGGFITKDNGDLVGIVRIINASPYTSTAVLHATSTDGGLTWPPAGSWIQDFDSTGLFQGLPDDWQRIGNNWYSIGETNDVLGTGERYSKLLKFDGNNISIVSTLTSTPRQTSEGGVASTGGNNLVAVLRDSPGGTDISAQTIKETSSSLGTSWSAQTDISSQVGIIQDPDLTWISGTPGNGTLMLHGRQGPNVGSASGGFRQEDSVAWFSDDSAVTWKNKTVLTRNKQYADGTGVAGGYTSAIADTDFTTVFTWADYYTPSNPTIGVRRIYPDLLDTLELHCYRQNQDILADAPFSNGGLSHYIIESRSMSISTANTDIASFIFEQGIGVGKKVVQYYVPRTTGDIGYLNGATATSVSIYNGFNFSTNYLMQAEINTANSGSEISSVKAYNQDRSSLLGSVSNRPYSLGSPTAIDTVEIGTDTTSGYSLSHIDFILLRKVTNNIPAISSYGSEELASVYPS